MTRTHFIIRPRPNDEDNSPKNVVFGSLLIKQALDQPRRTKKAVQPVKSQKQIKSPKDSCIIFGERKMRGLDAARERARLKVANFSLIVKAVLHKEECRMAIPGIITETRARLSSLVYSVTVRL